MSDACEPPTVIVIFGPPAVGKMTVGHECALRTGLKLFHNHHAIELVLPFFPFGSPPYSRLVKAIRKNVFEEIAASDLPGLIFTYVWAFDHPSDEAAVDELTSIFSERGGRVLYVELAATQEERLRRNETEFRLEQKASKRDIVASRERLLEVDARYDMDSAGRFDGRGDYLRIENSALPASQAAERIIAHFGLRRLGRNAQGE